MNSVQTSSVNCVICLESLSSKYVTLECKHLLDISCQQKNIKKSNLNCPLCRADIRQISSVHGISLDEFSSIKLDTTTPSPRLTNVTNETETGQSSSSEQSSRPSVTQTRTTPNPSSHANNLIHAWQNQFDSLDRINVVKILNECFDYSCRRPESSRSRILEVMLPSSPSYSNRLRVKRPEEREIIAKIFLNSEIRVNRKITENDIPKLLR